MICCLRRASREDIEGLLEEPEGIGDFLGTEEETEIDKTWHGLHFLFTGTAWEGEEPACFLVRGGRDIGDVDVGYGPARALLPDDVRRFDDFLRALTPEALEARYDVERMEALEIYPQTWARAAAVGESDFGYLLGGFETLQEFVAGAREAGTGLIIYVS